MAKAQTAKAKPSEQPAPEDINREKINLPALDIEVPRYEKTRRGRPTDYKPEYCELVQELGMKGWSLAQIAAYLGHGRKTLYNWMDEHEEFLHAITQAHDLALAWWEHAGQNGMFMTSFSANAWGLQVRNRFSKDYQDKRELAVTGHEDAIDKLK